MAKSQAKPGRKSAAEKQTRPAPGSVLVIRRPEPPLDMPDPQAEIWRMVVGRMPADWFPAETWPLLVQYCRHKVMADRIAYMIDALWSGQAITMADDEQPAEDAPASLLTLDRLLRLQRLETTALGSLSTRMRISQQSSHDRLTAGTKKRVTANDEDPWDYEG